MRVSGTGDSDVVRRVTIVTGGGRGIGAATALRLARDGHAVCVGYRSESAAAEQVAERVRAAGGACLTAAVDVSDDAAVDRLFDRTIAELGPVTGLVNNAGVTGPFGRLTDLPVADLRRVMEVNIVGCALAARRAVREMSTRDGGSGGAIVNLSSGAATIGSPGEYVHYAASKAAVDTFTLGLAKEVAAEGIRVNAVAPGLIDTEIHARSGDPDRLARMAPQVPIQRAGHPDEIAAAIAWLLSDDASYTTGTVLRVAGGR